MQHYIILNQACNISFSSNNPWIFSCHDEDENVKTGQLHLRYSSKTIFDLKWFLLRWIMAVEVSYLQERNREQIILKGFLAIDLYIRASQKEKEKKRN